MRARRLLRRQRHRRPHHHHGHPCGYTYTRYADLGARPAMVRTTWEVTNRTSTGHFEQRAPIVRETQVTLNVFEIQTVGAG